MNPYKILKKIHKKTLGMRHESHRASNLRQMAKILNDNLYPEKTDFSSFISDLQKRTGQLSIQDFSDIDYSKLNDDTSSINNAIQRLANDYNEKVDETEKSYNQVKNFLKKSNTIYSKKIQEFLNSPKQESPNFSGVRIKDFINALERHIDKYILTKDNRDNINKIKSKLEEFYKNENFITLFNLAEEILALSILQKPSTKIRGDFFENVIADILEDKTKDIITSVEGSVRKELEQYVKNSKSVENFSPTAKSLKFTLRDGTILDITDESFNPWTERYGKTDVSISDSQEKKMGISAKNWTSFSFIDKKGTLKYVGFSTNFIYALTRTLGIDNAVEWGRDMRTFWGFSKYPNLFKQLVKNYSIENQLEIYHQLARYTIVADSILGYSQSSDYADILIINNNQTKKIYVASVFNLLEKIYANIKNFQIEEYESLIHNIDFSQYETDKDFLLAMRIAIHLSIKDIQRYIQFYGRNGKLESINL